MTLPSAYAALGETARNLDKQGKFEPPPNSLGGASITELLEAQRIRFDVDPKYPQAVGISKIYELTNTFGNCRWEVLVNEFSDSPFFTSDFPVALEVGNTYEAINRVVPLTPNLAIRVFPNLREEGEPTFEFPRFARSIRKPPRSEVKRINTLLVQGAESMVFFRDNLPWIPAFVARNAPYLIKSRLDRIALPTGTVLHSSLRLEHI